MAEKLEKELYNSYHRFKMQEIQDKKNGPLLIQDFSNALKLFFSNTTSCSGAKQNQSKIQFPNKFLEGKPNILKVSFEAGLEICKKQAEIFYICFEAQQEDYMDRKNLFKSLTEVSKNHYVILLKRSRQNQRYIEALQKHEYLNRHDDNSTLLACRFNIAEQFVVFGSLNTKNEEQTQNFKLFVKNEDQSYRRVERHCRNLFENQEKKKLQKESVGSKIFMRESAPVHLQYQYMY